VHALAAALLLFAPKIVEFGPTFPGALGGIAVAPNRDVWISECDGIARISAGGAIWQSRGAPGAPFCDGWYGPRSIGIGFDGSPWLSTPAGIARFTGRASKPFELVMPGIAALAFAGGTIYTTKEGTPGVTAVTRAGASPMFAGVDDIRCIAAAGNGSVWALQARTNDAGETQRRLLLHEAGGNERAVAGDYVQANNVDCPLAADSDGILITAVYVAQTQRIARQTIVRISPDGSVRTIGSIPVRTEWPSGIRSIALAPDRTIWFADAANRVGRIAAGGTLTEFRRGIPSGATPSGIAVDRDGSAWFIDTTKNTVGHVTTDGAVRAFGNGLMLVNIPGGPVVTSDGAVWFRETLPWHVRIARLAPDGSLREFADPNQYATNVALQPAGNEVEVASRFGSSGGTQLERVSPDGTVHPVDTDGCLVAYSGYACLPALRGHGELKAPGTSKWTAAILPQSVVVGPDGALWFTRFQDDSVGRIDARGNVRLFTKGITRWNSGPNYITNGPDGALWFTEYRDRIGRITTDGKVTEFSAGIPRRSSIGGIVTGCDGNLWFTLYHGNELARITPQGAVTRFHDGIYPSRGSESETDSVPFVDGRGRIWFNESQGGRIARATLGCSR
jgi:streptogramin lyase